MAEEKTVEELQAELKALQKENLERDIANAKAEKEAAETLKKEKEDEELRNQIREELKAEQLEELGQTSKIETQKTKQTAAETLQRKERETQLRENMNSKFGFGLKTYDESNGHQGGLKHG